MKKSLYIAILAFSVACGNAGHQEYSLTESRMQQYMRIYRELKQQMPNVLHDLQQDDKSLNSSHAQFAQVGNIAQKQGMESTAQFVELNAKIGTAFAVMQISKGLDKFRDAGDAAKIKEMETLLANPETPEAEKATLRKAIDDLHLAQKSNKKNWAQNKEWTDFVIERTQQINTAVVLKLQDLEMICKYESQIMETYMGLPAKIIPESQLM